MTIFVDRERSQPVTACYVRQGDGVDWSADLLPEWKATVRDEPELERRLEELRVALQGVSDYLLVRETPRARMS